LYIWQWSVTPCFAFGTMLLWMSPNTHDKCGCGLCMMWEMQANKSVSNSWHPFLMCSSMVGCKFWEQP
jgi:hypothetical protein